MKNVGLFEAKQKLSELVERARTGDAARPFLEDLRSLSPGDYVVHVEHGIGRYQGLVHKQVGSVTVDLIAIE